MGQTFAAVSVADWSAPDAADYDKSDAAYDTKAIGRGGLGVVHCYTHKKLKYKIAKKEYWIGGEGVQLTDDEKKMLEAIQMNIPSVINFRHDNIVSYFWTTKIAGQLSVYMEFCEDGSLANLISNQKKSEMAFDEAIICGYVRNIANGLEFLHGKKIIHRNMRPSNVLLAKDQQGQLQAKISDFGEGAALQDELTLRRTVIGPPRYMAPEMSSDMPYGNGVDVWAIGLIIHEMAILEVPNAKSAAPKIDDTFVPLGGKYSENLRDLVKKMLVKQVNDRIKSKDINKHAAMN